MVLFSRVELLQRNNFCHDLVLEFTLIGFFALFSYRFLFLRFIQDAWPVLCALIISLPIQSGGIMDHKKSIHEVFIGNFFWFVVDFNYFSVAWCTSTNLFIIWVIGVSICIAAYNLFNSSKSIESSFGTPKASSSNDGSSLICCYDWLVSFFHFFRCRLISHFRG